MIKILEEYDSTEVTLRLFFFDCRPLKFGFCMRVDFEERMSAL